MTLPLPQLDKREWSDLVEEGLARLPRHAPDWTDYNIHDPGITLLELLAYKTEQTLYQANRITHRLKRRILALLGPESGQIVTSYVHFPGAVTRPLSVPKGFVFELTDAPETYGLPLGHHPPRMRLARPIQIHDVAIERVDGQKLRGGSSNSASGPAQESEILIEVSFKEPLSEGGRLSILIEFEDVRKIMEVASAPPPEPAENVMDCAFVTILLAEDGRQLERSMILPPQRGWKLLPETAGGSFATPVFDGTDGMQNTGIVELDFPSESTGFSFHKGTTAPWPSAVRRVTLNAVAVEHATHPADESSSFPFKHVDLIRQPSRKTSDGFTEMEIPESATNIRVRLFDELQSVNKPISIQFCESLKSAGSTEWRFERENGLLRFGNGQYGKQLPEVGWLEIKYDELQPTDGVKEGSVWRPCQAFENWNTFLRESDAEAPMESDFIARTRLIDPPTQPFPTNPVLTRAKVANASFLLAQLAAENGGTLDGIPLKDILDTPAPSQSVTPFDFERLALDAPLHATVLRARAFPEVHLARPGWPEPGTISLIVLTPLGDVKSAANNKHQNEILRTDLKAIYRKISNTLAVARAMGTKLVVGGPHWADLWIEIQTEVGLPDDTASRVRGALLEFLDPLTGGPRGAGCPFGKLLTQQDIYDLVATLISATNIIRCDLKLPRRWLPWSLPRQKGQTERIVINGTPGHDQEAL